MHAVNSIRARGLKHRQFRSFLEDIEAESCDFPKEMESEEWVCDFAFAVDTMQKLNELNTKLQSKGVFICS